MSNNIEGKVVVITGASSGLGEAAARLLSAQGARVVLGARRVDRIQSLANELAANGGKALAVPTDVTDRAQVQRLVDDAVRKFGTIDVMLNNAGLMPQSLLDAAVQAYGRIDVMMDVDIDEILFRPTRQEY